MAHRYLLDAGQSLRSGQQVSLLGAEARHAATVGRISVGEVTSLGDGLGNVAGARVSTVSAKEVVLEVLDVQTEALPVPEIWLVQALAKGDRDERAIQACTELGVDRVIPWASSRSISVWKGDKAESGVERWQRIVTEASKQSLRSWIPLVDSVATTAQLVGLCATNTAVVLEPTAPSRLMDFLPLDDRPIMVIVGPEGGISPEELGVLSDAGAGSYRLGQPVLRTSTAGPAALAVLSGVLGRW
ncbi:MAG: 16S rRNA (uracil(1498)-N(3))-methyltransferase [Pontimonas sp.]